MGDPRRPQDLLGQGAGLPSGRRPMLCPSHRCGGVPGGSTTNRRPHSRPSLRWRFLGRNPLMWTLAVLPPNWTPCSGRPNAADFTWLARVAQGVHAGLPGSSSCQDAVRTIIDSCEQRGDEWGAALVAASAALMQWRAGRPDIRAFDALAGRFRRLDAGALEAWAQSAQALVQCHDGPAGSHRGVAFRGGVCPGGGCPRRTGGRLRGRGSAVAGALRRTDACGTRDRRVCRLGMPPVDVDVAANRRRSRSGAPARILGPAAGRAERADRRPRRSCR